MSLPRATASSLGAAAPRLQTKPWLQRRQKRSPVSLREQSVPHNAEKAIEAGHASISDVVGNEEQTVFQRLISSQPFWVMVALAILVIVMSVQEPSFGTSDNAA